MHGLQPGQEVREVVGLVGLEADFVVQVAAAGGHGEDLECTFVEAESGDDVFPYAPRGCRSETHDWDVGDFALEPDEFLVGGAEVVAPF